MEKCYNLSTPEKIVYCIVDTSLYCVVEGTVVKDAFPSSFGGNIFSSNINQYVGKRDNVYFSPYVHAVAEGILEGTNKKIELLPDFKPVAVSFYSRTFGKIVVTHDIIFIGEEDTV